MRGWRHDPRRSARRRSEPLVGAPGWHRSPSWCSTATPSSSSTRCRRMPSRRQNRGARWRGGSACSSAAPRSTAWLSSACPSSHGAVAEHWTRSCAKVSRVGVGAEVDPLMLVAAMDLGGNRRRPDGCLRHVGAARLHRRCGDRCTARHHAAVLGRAQRLRGRSCLGRCRLCGRPRHDRRTRARAADRRLLAGPGAGGRRRREPSSPRSHCSASTSGRRWPRRFLRPRRSPGGSCTRGWLQLLALAVVTLAVAGLAALVASWSPPGSIVVLVVALGGLATVALEVVEPPVSLTALVRAGCGSPRDRGTRA